MLQGQFESRWNQPGHRRHRLRHDLYLVKPPTELPIALADVKQHLNVTFPDDDAKLTGLMKAACGLIDAMSAHMTVCMMPQQWLQTFDHAFPFEIELDLPPVISVDSIAYVNPAGTAVTLDPSAYDVFPASRLDRVRIRAKEGTCWPITDYRRPEAVSVTYTAGYAVEVPSEIKIALMFIVEDLYLGARPEPNMINPTAALLLGDYRRQTV